jgi:hypothetical protein
LKLIKLKWRKRAVNKHRDCITFVGEGIVAVCVAMDNE